MPRADDTEDRVIRWCREEVGINLWEGEPYAIDLCADCWCQWDDILAEVDHPPYEECDGYECELCGKILTEKDN